MRRLRHAPARCVGATVVANAHTACGPVGGWSEVEFAVADVRVGAIADHCGAVHAGSFGNQEVGAGLGHIKGGEQGNENEGFDGFHDVVFFWGKDMFFLFTFAEK